MRNYRVVGLAVLLAVASYGASAEDVSVPAVVSPTEGMTYATACSSAERWDEWNCSNLPPEVYRQLVSEGLILDPRWRIDGIRVNELVRDTGATIIVHEKAVIHLAAGRSDPDDRPINQCIGLLVGIYSLFHQFVFPPVVLRDRDLIISGDDDSLLARIGVDGKIIHTPGHTGDSISVILSDGSAIVGDAAMNFMEFCRTRHRPIYVHDLEQTFQSWAKLRERGAQVIYPSHGDPFAAEELVAVG